MNEDMVRRAVQSAAREAFNMGRRSGGQPAGSIETMRQDAQRYAEELIIPMITLALDEASEQGFTLAKRDAVGPGDAA